jgi:subtilisin family serine protease
MKYRRERRREKYFEAVRKVLDDEFESAESVDDGEQVLYHPRRLVLLPPASAGPGEALDLGFLRLVEDRLTAMFGEGVVDPFPLADSPVQSFVVSFRAGATMTRETDSLAVAQLIQDVAGETGQACPEYYAITQQYIQPGEDPDPTDPVPGMEELAGREAQEVRDGPGRGMTIAVLDTGVDEVVDRVVPSGQHLHDPIADVDELHVGAAAARSSSRGLRYLAPGAGHGTFMASLIHLVAPGATVISIKVANPLGLATESDVIKGIERALGAGANIINLSLGGYAFRRNSKWPTLAAFGLLEQAIASVPTDIAIVAAAGNSGADTPFYPAAFSDRVIGVAALDDDARLWRRSNYGNWVRACAIGVGLRSLFVTGTEDADYLPSGEAPNDFANDLNYARWSGTSFAAPLVAAQIAVVADVFGLASTAEAADRLLAMSTRPYEPRPCGRRVLVHLPGQT